MATSSSLSSSQDQHQVIHRTSAWKAKQKEIDDFILDGQDAEISSVAYLQSAHASGKSTTLVNHLCALLKEQGRNSTLIYVQATEVARDSLVEFQGLHDGKFIDPETTTLTYYDEFVDMLHAGRRLPNNATLLVDVELRASVAGEMFFGKLVELVETDDPVLTILLMSPHISDRTLQAFRVGEIGRVKIIVVPDINPKLTVEYIDNDETFAHALEQIRAEDPTACAFVSGSDTSFSPYAKYFTTSNSGNLSQLSAEPGFTAVVDPEIGMSLTTKNLRILLSQGRSSCLLFDTKTSLIVRQDRLISSRELEQDQSWALKTSSNPESVQVLARLSANEASRLPRPVDPWGPAWNADLAIMTLSIIKEWPGRTQLPIRSPPDEHAWKEMIRRLTLIGCIEPLRPGNWSLTKLGQNSLDTFWKYRSIAGMDFHIAYFLACSHNHAHNSNIQRVIIRLAVILAFTPAAFILKDPRGPLISDQELQELCAGIGQKQFLKGGVWVALGLYIRYHEKGDFSSIGEGHLYEDKLVIDRTIGNMIYQTVLQIEADMNIQSSPSELKNTYLNDDDIILVEKDLMWGWLHRAVGIDAHTSEVTDVVSMKTVRIIPEDELLNLDTLCSDPVNRRIGGLFAIHNGLEYVTRAGRKDLVAKGLTIVPLCHYQDVEAQTGQQWMLSAVTTYPLH